MESLAGIYQTVTSHLKKVHVPLYSFLYSDECSFHHRQVLQLIHTSLAIEKFFHEKPSERYRGPVFMLER